MNGQLKMASVMRRKYTQLLVVSFLFFFFFYNLFPPETNYFTSDIQPQKSLFICHAIMCHVFSCGMVHFNGLTQQLKIHLLFYLIFHILPQEGLKLCRGEHTGQMCSELRGTCERTELC